MYYCDVVQQRLVPHLFRSQCHQWTTQTKPDMATMYDRVQLYSIIVSSSHTCPLTDMPFTFTCGIIAEMFQLNLKLVIANSLQIN